MVTVFVEYQVSKENWESYLSSISKIRGKSFGLEIESHNILTSYDQPGLVVEIFEVHDRNTAEKLRQHLRQEGRLWNKKLHIWVFQHLNM